MSVARRFLLTAVAALVGLALLGMGSAAPVGAEELDTRAMENEFVSRINDLRASQGLAVLASDNGQLRDVAVAWSGSMANAGSISHRPNLADVAPSNWTRLGENVGVGHGVESLHNAFVASPGHYRNLVDPAFKTIAVGIVVRDGRIFVTENFMAASGGGVTTASAGDNNGAAAAPAAAVAAAPAKACKAKKCKAPRKAAVRRAPARRR
jgi:hypothetical protein